MEAMNFDTRLDYVITVNVFGVTDVLKGSKRLLETLGVEDPNLASSTRLGVENEMGRAGACLGNSVLVSGENAGRLYGRLLDMRDGFLSRSMTQVDQLVRASERLSDLPFTGTGAKAVVTSENAGDVRRSVVFAVNVQAVPKVASGDYAAERYGSGVARSVAKHMAYVRNLVRSRLRGSRNGGVRPDTAFKEVLGFLQANRRLGYDPLLALTFRLKNLFHGGEVPLHGDDLETLYLIATMLGDERRLAYCRGKDLAGMEPFLRIWAGEASAATDIPLRRELLDVLGGGEAGLEEFEIPEGATVSVSVGPCPESEDPYYNPDVEEYGVDEFAGGEEAEEAEEEGDDVAEARRKAVESAPDLDFCESPVESLRKPSCESVTDRYVSSYRTLADEMRKVGNTIIDLGDAISKKVK